MSMLSPLKRRERRRRRRRRRFELSTARRTQQAAVNRELPPDVITSILARVPAKALQRFRCACKPWASLIQDGYLVAQHLNHSLLRNLNKPPAPGFLTSYSDFPQASGGYTLNCYSYSGGGDDGAATVVHKFDLARFLRRRGHPHAATNSCNGLIGVFDRFGKGFYIVNPSIRKMRALPTDTSHVDHFSYPLALAGLSYDASTGEYKAVRVFDYCLLSHDLHRTFEVRCEEFSFGGGGHAGGWKLVDPPHVVTQRGFHIVHNGDLRYVDPYTESMVWPWPSSSSADDFMIQM